jgi:hypothetical protein
MVGIEGGGFTVECVAIDIAAMDPGREGEVTLSDEI